MQTLTILFLLLIETVLYTHTMSSVQNYNYKSVEGLYKYKQITKNKLNFKNLELLNDQEFYTLEFAAHTNYKCYIIGGWIRDRLLNEEPNDLDLVVRANDINVLLKVIDELYIERDKIIKRNPTLAELAKYDYDTMPEIKPQAESEFILLGKHIDLDILRESYSYINETYTSTNNITVDALTREFTINSIYYSYEENKIIDPLNGIYDLENNILSIINGQKPLLNNPFTIYRVIKMQVRYSMILSNELKDILKDNKFHDKLDKLLTLQKESFDSKGITPNRFQTDYENIAISIRSKCKLCILYLMKEYKLFKYYIERVYLDVYSKADEIYDNYIMNVAVVSEYVINNFDGFRGMDKFINLYSKIFAVQKQAFEMRNELNDKYKKEYINNNNNLILISLEYCRIISNGCYNNVLTFIDDDIIIEVYNSYIYSLRGN